jgi:hypothetical protein
MIETFSLLTLAIAKGFGVLILAVALNALTAPQRLIAVLADFERSPGLAFMGALMALIMGLVLVTLHDLWTDPLAILVTLLGWALLIKGVLLLAIPGGFLKFGRAMIATPSSVRVYGVIALILAVILLAGGFFGRAVVGA